MFMNTLDASIRNTKTKGELNAIRNSGNVPGVVYGGKELSEKVLISKKDDPKIVNQFLNIIELAVYKRKIKGIVFNIHVYDNNSDLIESVKNNLEPGTVFFGPISTENTLGLDKFCKDGVIFFSFSSNRSLANDCIFLINFLVGAFPISCKRAAHLSHKSSVLLQILSKTSSVW